MIKERATLTNDEIIEAYLRSCKKRVNEIKNANRPEEEKKEVKKKGVTKIKKLYPIYSKIALSLGLIIAFGSLLASIIVPDVTAVIMAILEEFDFMKQFRGGNALDPSDYVNLFKYK